MWQLPAGAIVYTIPASWMINLRRTDSKKKRVVNLDDDYLLQL
jgi:hypothetical protein